MKSKFFIFWGLLLLLFACSDNKESGVKFQMLEDSEYFVPIAEKHGKISLPRSIQLQLKQDTVLRDLFFKNFFETSKWTDTISWSIKGKFFISNEILKSDKIELCFPYIDTYADVFFNDSLLFSADNFFRNYEVDITELAKHGDNFFEIKFYPFDKAKQKTFEQSPYYLPFNGLECVRKPYFQFDTTMGITYIPSGTGRPYIRYWKQARIDNTWLKTLKFNKKIANLQLVATIEASENTSAQIIIKQKNKVFAEKDVELFRGKNTYSLEFSIKNPALWNTHDIGKPNLYKFKIELYINKELKDINYLTYGIREIKTDTSNNEIKISINGNQLYIKAIKHIPLTLFPDNFSYKKYQQYIDYLLKAGINTIYVSRNGWYEKDYFYDLCDEKGILIIQDFMLPYDIYPPNNQFIKEITYEVRYQVERLRNHPSIAFWTTAGDFKKTMKLYKNFYTPKDTAEIRLIYEKIFKINIKNIVSKIDKRPYFANMHYHNIVIVNDNVPSFPGVTTLRGFLPRENQTYENVDLMKHVKPFEGYAKLKEKLRTLSEMPVKIENLVYLSQLYTYKDILKKLEKLRINKKIDGLIINNFTDFSPVISFSALDYNLYQKGKFFAVKKIFSPLIAIVREKDGWLNINFISDYQEDVDVDIYFKISDFEGKTLWRKNYTHELIKSKDITQFNFDIGNIVKSRRNFAVFKAEVYKNQELALEKYYFFTSEKNLKLLQPNIKTSLFKIDEGYVIELTTDYLAKDIYVYTTKDGFFSDNFFDIIPGESKKIYFYTDNPNIDVKDFKFIDFTQRFDPYMFMKKQ